MLSIVITMLESNLHQHFLPLFFQFGLTRIDVELGDEKLLWVLGHNKIKNHRFARREIIFLKKEILPIQTHLKSRRPVGRRKTFSTIMSVTLEIYNN